MILLKNDFENNTNNDEKYKEETEKLQDSNESVDNSEISDTLCDDSIINKTKEEEALLQKWMNMNFKYHLIQSLIDIVSLCGGK